MFRSILQPTTYNLEPFQKGQSSAYIIIFIIVIIFAVMLAGGGSSLFSGNEARPAPSSRLTPTNTTTTGSVTADWKLVVNTKGCQAAPPGMAIEILPEGSKDGYIVAEIEVSPGTYLATAFQSFAPPKQAYTYVLPSARGYNTKNWKIELYEGGTKDVDTYTGGTMRGSFVGTATGCN